MVQFGETERCATVCNPVRHVYIYADDGASERSVQGWYTVLHHIFHYPRKYIKLTYAHSFVADITGQAPHHTAVIFPGGADRPYMKRLRGDRIQTLRAVIASGASYIGTCAGAYFASSSCIFEAADSVLKVVDARPLSLFAQPAIGAVSPGFEYRSESGATVESLACVWNHHAFKADVYCNGGPAWACVEHEPHTTVIARYTRPALQRHGVHDQNPAAVLLHSFGRGVAVLCGVHPEMIAQNSINLGLFRLLLAMAKAARLLQ